MEVVEEEEGGAFACGGCEFEATDDAGLCEHVKNNHGPDSMQCTMCGDIIYRYSFPKHARRVHGFELRGHRKPKPENDNVGDLCKVELMDDIPTRSVDLNFPGIECEFCKQSYSNELNLKKHIYNVHRMQRITCEVCGREVNKKSLDRHMKSVHAAKVTSKKLKIPIPDDQKIPCYLCAKKCNSWMSLNSHIKNMHEVEQFKCSQCDYTAPKKYLDRHMKKEHNDEVYQCEKCSKILKSKSTLKEHMWIHTDHRRFICDICGMRFKRTSNYHGHMKSHQEKKFQCHICFNFFLRKRYLAVHQQTIHNYYGDGVMPQVQEKGYQCEICGVKLKWKNNLMAHMRIHTGEKPYKCKICGDDFTCHGSLRTHMSKHAVHAGPCPESTVLIQSAYLRNQAQAQAQAVPYPPTP